MANEYRIVLPKQPQGGFASSPDQTTGNSSSPALDAPLTARNAISLGTATVYGKKVVGVGFQAVINQLGNSRLEENIDLGKKGVGLLGLGILTGGVAIPLLAIGAEVVTSEITKAVETHNERLENNRIVQERGTRINFGAGGYYG